MTDFQLPDQEVVSTEKSEFTKQEMVDLSHAKRSTALYEQRIEEHKSKIDLLLSLLHTEKTEKREVTLRCADLQVEATRVPELLRSKTEITVAFLFSGAVMALSGLAISSHPPVNGVAQWQATVGFWAIIIAVVLGVFSRAVVWFIQRFCSRLFHGG